ncbi:MAG: hypothetical protein AAF624_18400 [Bacteroidota bacterium]
MTRLRLSVALYAFITIWLVQHLTSGDIQLWRVAVLLCCLLGLIALDVFGPKLKGGEEGNASVDGK